MLVSDLMDMIFVDSGQYVLPDIRYHSMDMRLFYNGVIRRALETYARYRPLSYRFTRFAETTGNAEGSVHFGAQVMFTPLITEEFYPFVGERNQDPGMVPRWVSNVIPVNVLTTAGILYLIQETRFSDISEQSILHEPRTFLWRYESPVLYTTEVGGMDVTAHYDYPVEFIFDPTDTKKVLDVEIKGIDDAHESQGTLDLFIDLCTARFMRAIGRSRRTFNLNDLPLTMDAAELVSEARELETETMSRLQESSKWWEAIGG